MTDRPAAEDARRDVATDGRRWAGDFVNELRGTGDLGWLRD